MMLIFADFSALLAFACILNYLEKYYIANGEYPLCSGVMDQSTTTVVTDTLKGMDPTNLAIPDATSNTNSIVCSDTTSDAFIYISSGLQYTLKYKSDNSGLFIPISSQKKPSI